MSVLIILNSFLINHSFYWDSLQCKAEQPLRVIELKRHGVKRKRSTKRLKYTGNLLRKNQQLKSVC